MDDDIPYLLLTPGPLTTSRTVREAMMRDYCTWDSDYKSLVNGIRTKLVQLAGGDERYTAVLMQGSGTFVVEATIGSVIPPAGKLLVVSNGAYGARMAQIAQRLGIACHEIQQPEDEPADVKRVERSLREDPQLTHVALVHCETTTGLLNPAAEIGSLAARYNKTFILDAMSSFGGIPLTVEQLGCHFLISSANKCLQGVPGFGFVIAQRDHLSESAGWARSLSLDLYDQWREMEQQAGKWRYTSPTHAVRALKQALDELEEEGGVEARHRRYATNQQALVEGLRPLGFNTFLRRELQSPFITSFLYPPQVTFSFADLYAGLKRRRFVIYPGKVTAADTFRIGTIGHVFPEDIQQLCRCMREVMDTEL